MSRKKFKKDVVKSLTLQFSRQESDWLDECGRKMGKSNNAALFSLIEDYAKGRVGDLVQDVGMGERMHMLNLQLKILLEKLGGSTPLPAPRGKPSDLQGAELTDQSSTESRSTRKGRS